MWWFNIFEYNQNLLFTKIAIKYGPIVSNDAGDYEFDCFASLNDLQRAGRKKKDDTYF